MTEITLLRALLLFSMAVAPYATFRFVAEPSRRRAAVHAVALACAAAGLFSPLPALSAGWLLFCAGSLAWFIRRGLRQHGAAFARSPHRLVMGVPLLFSNVAAVWLVGGTNDLRILEYGPTFSFYASLHGNVLGWMLVGAIAALAVEDRTHRTLHLVSAVVCFASFLFIAVGIDQLRALKPIGVLGLSAAIPVSQLAFLRAVGLRHGRSFALGVISFLGLVATMILAWQYELAGQVPSSLGSIRGMVSVHGALNAVVVAPSFVLAVALARGDLPSYRCQRRPASPIATPGRSRPSRPEP